jgi:hypothetical protein
MPGIHPPHDYLHLPKRSTPERYIFGTYSMSSVSRWQGELGQHCALLTRIMQRSWRMWRKSLI